MKNKLKILFTFLLIITIISSYGQSKRKMESYLTNEWESAAIAYETGDTIQNLEENIHLKKKGKMSGRLDGVERTGTWKYIEESKQLELTINIGGGAEPVLLDIGKSSDQILSITRNRGDTYRSIIFVEKGSGIVFETVKAPEMSFEEIQAQSDASKNSDLGYSPPGDVLIRFDFNRTVEKYEDGGGSSGEIGIVYLLDIDAAKKVVIIRGHNGAPEEWDVLGEKLEDDQTVYNCNLQYDYKRGEKIEVNKKANLSFNDSNVFMIDENNESLEFTSE